MKLIILNGPCGVGKSTLGKKIHEAIPLSLRIDIDELRRNINHYRENAKVSSDRSFALAYDLVDSYLAEGGSVIVDKIILNIHDYLDKIHSLAHKHKAEVYEFILWAEKSTVHGRVRERGYKPNGLLTPEKVDRFWHEISELKETRKDAFIIDTETLTEEQVFEKAMSIIERQ